MKIIIIGTGEHYRLWDRFEQISEPLLVQSYATLFFVSFILCIIFYRVVMASLDAKLSMRWQFKVLTADLYQELVASRYLLV